MSERRHITQKSTDMDGNPIGIGDQCEYKPDSLETMFGEVPAWYENDLCEVVGFAPPLGVLVAFEGDRRQYKVDRACLVLVEPKAPPADEQA